MSDKITKQQRQALTWMEQAADIRCLSIMTAGKTEWAGDLFVNHLTAKALERKNRIVIDWSPYEDDDVLLYVREDTR